MKILKTISICGLVLASNVFAAEGMIETKDVKANTVQTADVITNQNDVISKTQKNDLLSNPEVIRLMNESYKKGFIEGAEESKMVMKKRIEKMGKFMDELFAFHKLYLEGKLEPPKIGVVSQPVQVTKEGKVMVLQQEYLEIIEPAKFVDKPKDWKNFLWK